MRPNRLDENVTAPSARDGAASPGRAAGDYDKLVRLFAEASPLTMSHWNPKTGEVFSLPRGKNRRDAAERFEARLWQEPDWVEVPHLESDAAFALAGEFVAALEPGRGKARALEALSGPKPFRALRLVLAGAPGLARRYQRFVDAEAELRLATYCASQGLELGDPRFAVAVGHARQAFDDAVDPEAESNRGDPTHAEPGKATLEVAALSIGRRRRPEP